MTWQEESITRRLEFERREKDARDSNLKGESNDNKQTLVLYTTI